MEILSFSPRVFEEARAFFAAHPVYRLEQEREINEYSPIIRIVEGRCDRCGLTMKPTRNTFPADTLRAVTLWHDWNLGRSEQCGGQVEFVTEPL